MSTSSTSINLEFKINANAQQAISELAAFKQQLAGLSGGGSLPNSSQINAAVGVYNNLVRAQKALAQQAVETTQKQTLFHQLFVDKNQQVIHQYTNSIGGLVQAYQKINAESGRVIVTHNGLKSTLGDGVNKVDMFRVKADLLGQTLYNVADKMQRTGYQAQYMGRQLITFVTAPIEALVKETSAYGEQLSVINTQITTTLNFKNVPSSSIPQYLTELKKQADDLSKSFGNLDDIQLGKVQAQMAKLTTNLEEIKNLTELVNQYSAITGQDSTISAQQVSDMYQASNQNYAQTKKNIAEITALSESSSYTIQESTQAIQQLMPVMKQFGLGVSQANIFLEALNTSGINDAAKGADTLSRMFEVLAQKAGAVGVQGDTSKKKLTGLALSVAQFNAANPQQAIQFTKNGQFDLNTGLASLERAWPLLNAAQKAAFATEISNAKLASGSSALFTGMVENVNAVGAATATQANAVGNFNKSVGTFAQSDKAKYESAVNDMKQYLTTIGAQVFPIIANLTKTVDHLFVGFGKLPKPVKEFAVALGALLAIVGPIEVAFASLQNLTGSLLKGGAELFKPFLSLKGETFGAGLSPEATAYKDASAEISSSIRSAGKDAALAIKEAAMQPTQIDKMAQQLESATDQRIGADKNVIASLLGMDAALGDTDRELLQFAGADIPTFEKIIASTQALDQEVAQKGLKALTPADQEAYKQHLKSSGVSMAAAGDAEAYLNRLGPSHGKTPYTADETGVKSLLKDYPWLIGKVGAGGFGELHSNNIRDQLAQIGMRPIDIQKSNKRLDDIYQVLSKNYGDQAGGRGDFTTLAKQMSVMDQNQLRTEAERMVRSRYGLGSSEPLGSTAGSALGNLVQSLRRLASEGKLQAAAEEATHAAEQATKDTIEAAAAEGKAFDAKMVATKAASDNAIRLAKVEQLNANALSEMEAMPNLVNEVEKHASQIENDIKKNSTSGNALRGFTTVEESPALMAHRRKRIAQALAGGQDINSANYGSDLMATDMLLSNSDKNLAHTTSKNETSSGLFSGLLGNLPFGSRKNKNIEKGSIDLVDSIEGQVGQEMTKAAKATTGRAGLLHYFNPMTAVTQMGGIAKGAAGGLMSGEGLMAGIAGAGGGAGLAGIATVAAPLIPILLAVGAAIAAIVVNWNKIKGTAEQGINELTKSFGTLFNDIVDPFKSLLHNLDEVGGKGSGAASTMSTIWKTVGNAIGATSKIIAYIVSLTGGILKPVLEAIATIIGLIIHSIALIADVLTGKWGAALQQLKALWGDVRDLIGEVGKEIIDALATPLKVVVTMIDAMITPLSHLPLVGGMFKDAADSIKQFRGFLDGLGNDWQNMVSDSTSNGMQAGTQKAKTYLQALNQDYQNRFKQAAQDGLNAGLNGQNAAAYAMRVTAAYKDAMGQGISNAFLYAEQQTAGYFNQLMSQQQAVSAYLNAQSQLAQDTTGMLNDFLNNFQSGLDSLVSGWKQDAINAFDAYRAKAKQTYDDNAKASSDSIQNQITNIDRLSQAQSNANTQADLMNTILKDQQKNTEDVAMYTAKYLNDTYLGKSGNALIDQLDMAKAQIDNSNQIVTDQKKLGDEQLKEQQDAEKQALQDKKTALDKQTQLWDQTYDSQTTTLKQQLTDQLDLIVKNGVSVGDATQKGMDNIKSKISDALTGVGKLMSDSTGGPQAIFHNSFKDAVDAAAAITNNKASWAPISAAIQANTAILGNDAVAAFAKSIGYTPTPAAGAPGSAPPAPGMGVPLANGLPANAGKQRSLTLGQVAFHTGGPVGSYYNGPSDVPATLQTGEFVIQRQAVNTLGVGALHQLNNAHKYHSGGIVSQSPLMSTIAGGLNNHMDQYVDSIVASALMQPSFKGVKANPKGRIGAVTPDLLQALIGGIGGFYGAPASGSIAAVLAAARSFLGIPYLWGGTNPKIGLDCSGLVLDAFMAAGINLPRTSQQQYMVGSHIPSLAQAIPGDLVFYAGSDGTNSAPGHVGIFMGGGLMEDAAHTGTVVRYDPVGNPVGIRRIIGGASPVAGVGGLNPGQVVAGNIQTPIDFANALLNTMHFPDSASNIAALVGWEAAEGGNWHNTAYYNPLDTTQREAGSYSMNSVGVQAYTSWNEGLQATISTLTNGYYGGILGALAQGNNPYAVAAAVAASPWGTGNFSADIPKWFHIGGLVQLARGANVLSDGPAYLHKGESVLTKPLSAKLNNKLDNSGGDIHIHIKGFMGSQTEIDRLVAAIEKAQPRYQRIGGKDMTRRVSSF